MDVLDRIIFVSNYYPSPHRDYLTTGTLASASMYANFLTQTKGPSFLITLHGESLHLAEGEILGFVDPWPAIKAEILADEGHFQVSRDNRLTPHLTIRLRMPISKRFSYRNSLTRPYPLFQYLLGKTSRTEYHLSFHLSYSSIFWASVWWGYYCLHEVRR